jgi:hypothetical protein
VLTA